MPRISVDVGALPLDAREALIQKQVGVFADAVWVNLGTIGPGESPKEFNLGAEELQVTIRALVRRRNGKLEPQGRVRLWYANQPAADRPATPAQLPRPRIKQVDTAVKVTPQLAEGQKEDEHLIEVRVGANGGGPADALQVGFFTPGQEIALPMIPDALKQDVHLRACRADGRDGGTWRTEQMDLCALDTVFVPLTDQDNDLTAGTITDVASGIPTMETVAGPDGIRMLALPVIHDSAWNTLNVHSAAAALIRMRKKGTYHEWGEYTSPALGDTKVHCFQIQDFPVVTQPRPTINVHTAIRRVHLQPNLPLALEDADPVLDGANIDVHAATTVQTPLRIRREISLSQDGAAFSSFEDLYPGRDYTAMKYKLRFRLYTFEGDNQVHLTKWKILRRVRNRKIEFCPTLAYGATPGLMEYAYSPDPVLIDTTPKVSSAVLWSSAQIDTSFTTHHESITDLVAKIAVTMHCRGVETSDVNGDFTWVFPEPFLAAANVRVVATVVQAGSGTDLNVTLHTLAAGQVQGHVVDMAGNDVSGALVHIYARGVPVATNKKLEIIVTGY